MCIGNKIRRNERNMCTLMTRDIVAKYKATRYYNKYVPLGE